MDALTENFIGHFSCMTDPRIDNRNRLHQLMDIVTLMIEAVICGADSYADVEVFDSWADNREVKEEFGITLMNNLEDKKYDAIILAVAHNEFLEMDLSKLKKPSSIVYDVKGVLNKKDIDKRL